MFVYDLVSKQHRWLPAALMQLASCSCSFRNFRRSGSDGSDKV